MYNFGFLQPSSIMQHNIREAGTLTYVLEISASAEDLALDVQQAVRKKRSVSNLKGFRPGRVPHHWIKQVFKRELEEEITKTIVDEAFEDLVAQSGQYEVVGEPRRVEHKYALDGDLHVELEFITQSDFKLQDVEKQVLEVKCVKASNDLVKDIVEWLRKSSIYMRPLGEDEVIGEEGVGEQDAVLCKATEVDPATGVVLIGASGDEMAVELGEPAYKGDPEYEALCAALTGHKVGDQVLVKFTESPAEGVLQSKPEERAYTADILEAKRRQIPDIDAKWVRKISFGQIATKKAWPAAIKKLTALMVRAWNNKLRDEALEKRMIEIQAVPVPEGLVRRNLDEYRALSGETGSDDAARGDYFRQRLAWHYIQEQMIEQEWFEWPVESEEESSDKDPDAKILIELEDSFGVESRYKSAPTRRRCGLDYLESQFDIVENEEDASEEMGAIFAETAVKHWLTSSRAKSDEDKS